MDLSLSDEQKQLQDGAERFVRDKYTFENRRKIVATERGWLPENWAQFAELGWLGMAFSEEDGGYGGGPIETMIVMEQFGKGLVLEPFLPTVVLGGGMIAKAGTKAQKEALLAPMIEGKKQFAFAWLERQSRYNLADVALKATKEGAGWSLSGHKGVVYNAASADNIIVLARTSGSALDDPDGVAQDRRQGLDRAPQGGLGRQGADRQVGQVLRPECCTDARRHGRHRRALGQPLFQAADHDRPDVRQPAASPDALQQPRDGGVSAASLRRRSSGRNCRYHRAGVRHDAGRLGTGPQP